jgi:hypothetical protein
MDLLAGAIGVLPRHPVRIFARVGETNPPAGLAFETPCGGHGARSMIGFAAKGKRNRAIGSAYVNGRQLKPLD